MEYGRTGSENGDRQAAEKRLYGEQKAFRPNPFGCVTEDARMRRCAELLYAECYAAVAADIYRSLVTEGRDAELSALFDDAATAELEGFRTLGELVRALGGNGCFRADIRNRFTGTRSGEEDAASLARECVEEKRRMAERCAYLRDATGDAVVRAVLAQFEERVTSIGAEAADLCRRRGWEAESSERQRKNIRFRT